MTERRAVSSDVIFSSQSHTMKDALFGLDSQLQRRTRERRQGERRSQARLQRDDNRDRRQSDRRLHSRNALDAVMNVCGFIHCRSGQKARCRGWDVTSGGVGLYLPSPTKLAQGSPLRLDLFTGVDNNPIRVSAMVIWTHLISDHWFAGFQWQAPGLPTNCSLARYLKRKDETPN